MELFFCLQTLWKDLALAPIPHFLLGFADHTFKQLASSLVILRREILVEWGGRGKQEGRGMRTKWEGEEVQESQAGLLVHWSAVDRNWQLTLHNY